MRGRRGRVTSHAWHLDRGGRGHLLMGRLGVIANLQLTLTRKSGQQEARQDRFVLSIHDGWLQGVPTACRTPRFDLCARQRCTKEENER